MFPESYKQIPDQLNPETKHHDAKITLLRFIQTFNLLIEGLRYLRSSWIPFCAYLKAQK